MSTSPTTHSLSLLPMLSFRGTSACGFVRSNGRKGSVSKLLTGWSNCSCGFGKVDFEKEVGKEDCLGPGLGAVSVLSESEGLCLLITPENSSRAESAFSSKSSITSTTARQLSSMPSGFCSFGAAIFVLWVAALSSLFVSCRRRTFCESMALDSPAFDARWKVKSWFAIWPAVLVTLTSEEVISS